MLDAIVSAIANFLVDVVLTGIFYRPGWLVLRVVTWGRYPPAKDEEHNEQFVAMVGLAVFIAALAIAFTH